MPAELTGEAVALLRDVEQAARVKSVRLEPRLLRLAYAAPEGSSAWLYALTLLADGLLPSDPWRASLLMRRAVQACPSDDGAWGRLALAQSLLDNHEFAIMAYRRALKLQPADPWYAHNLGHLYDVVLDWPTAGAKLLGRAHRALPHNDDVTASYAHALVRMGEAYQARMLMAPIMRGPASADHHALYRYILEQIEDAIDTESKAAPQHAPMRRSRKRRFTC